VSVIILPPFETGYNLDGGSSIAFLKNGNNFLLFVGFFQVKILKLIGVHLRVLMMKLFLILAIVSGSAIAEIFFEERFQDGGNSK